MPLVGESSHATGPHECVTLASLREQDLMEQQAASRLRTSPYPEVRCVACEFREGMLRLRGRVPSYFLKQIAQTVVSGMDGVDEIHNQLEVVVPPDCP
jgi:osmotically-inducible protein OsmY